jgi:hypothetical protein
VLSCVIGGMRLSTLNGVGMGIRRAVFYAVGGIID